MSVSESDKECPLCMEALDWDDLGFFPCSCGYQICRFCWHRLRTDENGLCPACRQAFPDMPVSFNPEISAEELKKQKKRNKEKRSNKDQSFKPQDLATLRVVQKNLVFVIGLSSRLTQEDLKKEFAHFGKIIKFVHNKSTAYITYSKPEEAIRAIRTLNASAAQESAAHYLQLQTQISTTPATLASNTLLNNSASSLNHTPSFLNAISVPVPPNRLKASLGTTKYCNHFLRSQQCPKVGECMYLHEIAEAEASFTKEQMQAGKHVEYEKKLMDSYLTKMEWQSSQATQNNGYRVSRDGLPIQQQQQQQQPQQISNSHHKQLQQNHLSPKADHSPTDHLISSQQQRALTSQSNLTSAHHSNNSETGGQSPGLSFVPLQQQQQQQQQQQLVLDTDSEDDGLDFDPISVSTSGLRDLLDQQVQQAKQLQMQNYIQQMSANQSLANVLFQQTANNRLNHHPNITNGLINDSTSFNGHPQSLTSLASLNNPTTQQQQVTWQNLSAWTNFIQRSGYGFENGR